MLEVTFLKGREACEFLAIDYNCLIGMKLNGLVPFYQKHPRGRILYPLDGLKEYLTRNPMSRRSVGPVGLAR